MADTEGEEFIEKFLRPGFVQMLDAAAATRGDDSKLFGVRFEESGHKWTVALFEVSQNAHFIGESLLSHRSAKRFVHASIVADSHRRPQGVLHLFHRPKVD